MAASPAEGPQPKGDEFYLALKIRECTDSLERYVGIIRAQYERAVRDSTAQPSAKVEEIAREVAGTICDTISDDMRWPTTEASRNRREEIIQQYAPKIAAILRPYFQEDAPLGTRTAAGIEALCAEADNKLAVIFGRETKEKLE